jgi:hypothetical protein
VCNRSALALAKAVDESRKRGEMKRTPAGEERWEDLYYRLAADEPGGLLGAAVARDAAQCLRLSLLYALLTRAPAVDKRHIEAAEALWSYCRASAQAIFGDTLGDANADRLLEALRVAGPAGLDGRTQHEVFGRNVNAAELDRLRQLLETSLVDVPAYEAAGVRNCRTVAARARPTNLAEWRLEVELLREGL